MEESNLDLKNKFKRAPPPPPSTSNALLPLRRCRWSASGKACACDGSGGGSLLPFPDPQWRGRPNPRGVALPTVWQIPEAADSRRCTGAQIHGCGTPGSVRAPGGGGIGRWRAWAMASAARCRILSLTADLATPAFVEEPGPGAAAPLVPKPSLLRRALNPDADPRRTEPRRRPPPRLLAGHHRRRPLFVVDLVTVILPAPLTPAPVPGAIPTPHLVARRTAPFPRLCFTQRRRTSSPTSSPRLSTVPRRLRSPSTAMSRRSAPPLLLAVAAHRAPAPAPAAPITAVRTRSLWLRRPAPLPPPLATAATRCCCHLLLRSPSRGSWPPALAPARPGLCSAAAPVDLITNETN
nr:uncharacterized protein LOC109747489 [Aegilops tauschii subsp. strangulata]